MCLSGPFYSFFLKQELSKVITESEMNIPRQAKILTIFRSIDSISVQLRVFLTVSVLLTVSIKCLIFRERFWQFDLQV